MQKTIYHLLFSSFYLLIFFFLLLPNFLFATTLTATENVSVSAIVAEVTVTPTSGGGSGGGILLPHTSVQFSGEAYPNATITLLKNGKYITSVKAYSNGLFNITLEEKYENTILYSLYARDIAGNKSLLLNYPLVVTAGYLTYLSGIRFPPTIALDKIEASIGSYLTVGGYAIPNKELQIVIIDQEGIQKNTNSKIFTLTSSASGYYNITLPLVGLPKGNYYTYIKYTNDVRQSKLVKFIIGSTDILSIDTTLNIPGDCNADDLINLTDFSVFAFWYKKPNPPVCVDVNRDRIVDLTDFSILAFYWTN